MKKAFDERGGQPAKAMMVVTEHDEDDSSDEEFAQEGGGQGEMDVDTDTAEKNERTPRDKVVDDDGFELVQKGRRR